MDARNLITGWAVVTIGMMQTNLFRLIIELKKMYSEPDADEVLLKMVMNYIEYSGNKLVMIIDE